MKKEDLIKLGIDDETAQKIIVLHGQDIEGHKTRLSAAQTEADGLKWMLTCRSGRCRRTLPKLESASRVRFGRTDHRPP